MGMCAVCASLLHDQRKGRVWGVRGARHGLGAWLLCDRRHPASVTGTALGPNNPTLLYLSPNKVIHTNSALHACMPSHSVHPGVLSPRNTWMNCLA